MHLSTTRRLLSSIPSHKDDALQEQIQPLITELPEGAKERH
ncbi:MAG TPA: hypothetical protein QGG77_00320 [Prochlorococcaceae cyanobacterium Gl_MAG_24]|nr:hypothetical protein [Prochlorococcaceae cyanobacterium Gl_MAG_24]